MFHVILFEPEIPPNTGNVIRLCANTGCDLHLIEPLGFELSEARVRRAGLDYAEMTRVHTWPSLATCMEQLKQPRLFAVETGAASRYDQQHYQAGDALLFGPETRGLPEHALALVPGSQRISIPMQAGNRSLNLSNAVAVTMFEAWRQQDFAGRAGA
jgi:tRNA (cytidine/uridine-2'-O-)-methyltransferase